MRMIVPTLGLSLMLAACEGGGDPVEAALRDTVAANHAAVTKTTAEASSSHPAGATLDQAYIARMIEHHRGAVAMADVALAQSRDPEIRRMAGLVKDAQTREIAEMRAWRPAAQPTP